MLRHPADGTRLDILERLKEPATRFPPPRHPADPADPVRYGVDAHAVAAALGLTRPVAETHLALLTAVGLLRASRIGGRTYYRRDEVRIAEVARMVEKGWQAGPR